MSIKILTLKIKFEHDIVLARQRARMISALLGFDVREQTAISTSVSEIARNAFNYALEGTVEFILDEKTTPQVFLIKVIDDGPGIKDLDQILNGRYESKTGLGMGIIGSKRLMDLFNIQSSPGIGTTVILGKTFPKGSIPITSKDITNIADELLKSGATTPIEEITQQNQELLRSLDEIKKRQEELERVNKELEETNRGVVALYAELDEKAEHLRKVNEIKARFFSNMSHEFRTPLNSIIGLSKLLLDRVDGDLTEEQSKQVRFIKKSADELYETINDLLDLAKVESGKLTVKPVKFSIPQLFSTLRGSFKPLITNPNVVLIFEDVKNVLEMNTDERKVTQILRNFISNAIKFTEKGEIRVKAEFRKGPDSVIFSVADTGIGIAERDIGYIFEEFSQVETDLHKKSKGTGLGLPLTKKLADLLGGNVWVDSQPGKGSVFYARLLADYDAIRMEDMLKDIKPLVEISQETLNKKVLIIDDDETSRYLLKGFLSDTHFAIIEASNGRDGYNLAISNKPDLIFLDLIMPGLTGFEVLEMLRSNSISSDIPVIINTSKQLSEEETSRLRGFEIYTLNKKNWTHTDTLSEIRDIIRKAISRRKNKNGQ